MRTPIPIPQLGVIEEAVVTEWLRASGDAVTTGEALVAIETEKVATEIVSPADGVLEIVVEPGETPLAVGTVLGYVTSQ